jgi:feruloyl esterase
LDDPLACEFDTRALLCESGPRTDCLSTEQVQALDALYDGPRNPRTGKRIYFGQTPGSETAGGPPELPGWSLYWADPRQPERPARADFWQHWVFDDAAWDWWSFDFDADMRKADRRLAPVINAMDAELSGFREAGGRLLHYHGLNDPVVPATDSISYYTRVAARTDSVDDFYRLFVAPGVEHCRGGPGPDSIDFLSALEAWVERGQTPDSIIARKFADSDQSGQAEFSRPLCPYPAYAVYDGIGDSAAASSFECRSDISRPAIPKIDPKYLK